MKKVYFLDFGMRNFLLKQSRQEDLDLVPGAEIENFVYNALLSKERKENIYYYRTVSGSEIDFIHAKEDELIPIEVKYRRGIVRPTTALNNFSKRLKDKVKKRIIITKDYLQKENDTYFIPAVVFPFVK